MENEIYDSGTIDLSQQLTDTGDITEKDKLVAAKQILLGLGILFAIAMVLYACRPEHGAVLLEICKTVMPPLATLIIAFYFKEKK